MSKYWATRARQAEVEEATSRAMFRKTGDQRWFDIANHEADRAATYREYAAEARIEEGVLFNAA